MRVPPLRARLLLFRKKQEQRANVAAREHQLLQRGALTPLAAPPLGSGAGSSGRTKETKAWEWRIFRSPSPPRWAHEVLSSGRCYLWQGDRVCAPCHRGTGMFSAGPCGQHLSAGLASLVPRDTRPPRIPARGQKRASLSVAFNSQCLGWAPEAGKAVSRA